MTSLGNGQGSFRHDLHRLECTYLFYCFLVSGSGRVPCSIKRSNPKRSRIYLRKFSCDHSAGIQAAIWVKSNRRSLLRIELWLSSELRSRTSHTHNPLLNWVPRSASERSTTCPLCSRTNCVRNSSGG